MDFFGTGWDVAERMGLTDDLRAIRYPLDVMRYVDASGRAHLNLPLDQVRRALNGRYVYLLRSDLERILFDRARQAGVSVRFGTSIASMVAGKDRVNVAFDDGETGEFPLVIGADGVHSRVRELAFGPETSFARDLGYQVAAFHAPLVPEAERSVVLHEETDRLTAFYSMSDEMMDAMYLFRRNAPGPDRSENRLAWLQKQFADSGWIASRVLESVSASVPFFLDSLTQIRMPRWSTGRVCLIGDACGCLTLAAGQGSHMAMAGAYVLATELLRRPDDHAPAFLAYERFLRPHVERKQAAAVKLAGQMVPGKHARMWLRRLVIRTMFSPFLLPFTLRNMGSRSALRGYKG